MDLALSLISTGMSVTDAILKAREEMKSAPAKLDDLVGVVRNAQRILLRLEGILQAKSNYHTNRKNVHGNNNRYAAASLDDDDDDGATTATVDAVRTRLEQLARELDAARDKVEHYKRKDSSTALLSGRMMQTMLGFGASKQNQQTGEIKKRLEEALTQLDHVLNTEIFCRLFNLTGLFNSNGLVNRSILVPAQGTAAATAAEETADLVQKLDELAILTVGCEECTVSLEIGGVQGDDFHPAGRAAAQTLLDDLPISAAVANGRRAARDGGWEVPSSSKLRFRISVLEERFFYVVTYDLDEASPLLHFPRSPSANHTLSPKFARIFPDNSRYPLHDPLSFRIEKSTSHKLGRQFIYILLPLDKLHEDQPRRELKMKDIQQGIIDGLCSEVFKFVFDLVAE